MPQEYLSAPRKGANGVLLKKFEATLQQMFSLPSSSSSSPSRQALDALTPCYSVQPPRLSDSEREDLLDNARVYWKELGLLSNGEAAVADFCNTVDKEPVSPWPFDDKTSLPSIGHVKQSQNPSNPNAKTAKTKTGKDTGGVGDIMHMQRAWRKEAQIANLVHCVLSLLSKQQLIPEKNHRDGRQKIRIVDFAGGTGHLSVPLALLLPHCEVVCVDLKKWSLDLLHRRVDNIATDQNIIHAVNETQSTKTLPNLSSYFGSIQSYSDTFDIGISLHACGEASDWVLRKCLEQNASFVVCSCCCGKLSRDSANPYVYHSTGGNDNEIQYPQSKVFASLGQCDGDHNGTETFDHREMTPDMFDEIAKAADYSELGDLRKPRNACRRAAKSLVEWDRLLFAKEYLCVKQQSGYSFGNVVLTRMLPWEASTKNDILIGWPDDAGNPYTETTISRDTSCDSDFRTALQHLFGTNETESGDLPVANCNASTECANDWTAAEENEIRLQLESFLQGSNKEFHFPTGMGSRHRKLIHHAAEKMGFHHWGVGKKDKDKTVVVAKRRS